MVAPYVQENNGLLIFTKGEVKEPFHRLPRVGGFRKRKQHENGGETGEEKKTGQDEMDFFTPCLPFYLREKKETDCESFKYFFPTFKGLMEGGRGSTLSSGRRSLPSSDAAVRN